ncbi:hypothetical protein HAALTHF_40650n [Vreelandella aquamarina]|nr:hypothetical protein HAALTHF_40650n [Halomonas axialensis]
MLALIQVESAFNADAVSSAGAVGLMQIMPFWVAELGLPMDDLTEPNRNLRYGCTILAHYLAIERVTLPALSLAITAAWGRRGTQSEYSKHGEITGAKR